jgi:hypothetical protein
MNLGAFRINLGAFRINLGERCKSLGLDWTMGREKE